MPEKVQLIPNVFLFYRHCNIICFVKDVEYTCVEYI